MVRLIKGKDDVVREVTLLHKKHTIDRSLPLVCPVEIRAVENVDQDELQLRWLLRESQNNCKKKRIDKLNYVRV